MSLFKSIGRRLEFSDVLVVSKIVPTMFHGSMDSIVIRIFISNTFAKMKSECSNHPVCPCGTTSQPWDGICEILDTGKIEV